MDENNEPTEVGMPDFESLIQARIDQKVSEAKADTTKTVMGSVQIAVTKALQDALNDDYVSLDEEDATTIFNAVATNLRQDWDEPNWTKTWTVTVSYGGTDLLTIPDVEAEDEDEAIEEVKQNLDFTPAELKGEVSYQGDYSNVTIYSPSVDFDIEELLDFSAEQD